MKITFESDKEFIDYLLWRNQKYMDEYIKKLVKKHMKEFKDDEND